MKDTKKTGKGRRAQSRGKGEGTLVRHGRVWQARWMVDGKMYTRSTGTSDRREALAILEEFTKPWRAKTNAERITALEAQAEDKRAEVRHYVDRLPAMPLMAGFTAFKSTDEGRHPTADTAYMYECQYFRFVDWVKANHPEIKELRAVTRKTAREFSEYLAGKYSENTRKKYLSLLALIWKAIKGKEEDEREGDETAILTQSEARALARIEENPWERVRDQVKTSVSDATRRRALTVEEIGRIIDGLSGEMRLLFIIGCYTGARLEDCALLDWGQIDLVAGTITISPHKTRRHNPEPKLIPIHRTLAGELFQIPEKKRRGHVMPQTASLYHRDCPTLSRNIQSVFIKNGIQTQLKEEGKRAKVLVGFHSLRHFAATMISEKGKLEQAQYLLGHTSPDMTLHYNHPRLVALRQTIDALPAMGCADTSPEQTDAPRIDLSGIYAQLDALPQTAREEVFKHLADALPQAAREEVIKHLTQGAA